MMLQFPSTIPLQVLLPEEEGELWVEMYESDLAKDKETQANFTAQLSKSGKEKEQTYPLSQKNELEKEWVKTEGKTASFAHHSLFAKTTLRENKPFYFEFIKQEKIQSHENKEEGPLHLQPQHQLEGKKYIPLSRNQRLFEKNGSEVKEKGSERSEQTRNASRLWCHHDAIKWWDQRATLLREREEREKRDQSGEEESPEQRKQSRKPVLEKSKMGIFALYYILAKIGLFSEGCATFFNKKEIEALDAEMTLNHEKRIGEMKKALKKERSTERWGVMLKMFSWLGSIFGILSGVVLLASGAGVFMGAVLIAAGVIQLANHIMEFSGGWKKFAELLPGEDLQKKRAIIMWIQIAIMALCLISSACGIFLGGYSQMAEPMQYAQAMINAIVLIGRGVGEIGHSVVESQFMNKMADMKTYDKKIEELRHRRQTLLEMADESVEHIERLFEDLIRALEFEVELFRADQQVIRT